ncbi:MAG: hypothetical protein ACRCZF_03175, partial [Gemmataceae bacterium]
MDKLYLTAAGLGLTLVICQFLASFLGMLGDTDSDDGITDDHDTDAPTEHHAAAQWFYGLVGFRSLSTGLAFFGLGGLSALTWELPKHFQLPMAILAG